MKLFSGNSNRPLAEKIAAKLNQPLGKLEITEFGNSEIRVRVLENVREQTCYVIQSTSNPTNTSLMELFFTVDALKRAAAGRVIAVIPYFGYARQNQQHRAGEAVSAHVVISFLEKSGVDEVVTLDLHEEQLTGVFQIPVAHLSALPLLAENVGKWLSTEKKAIIVVSPDQGGIERARLFQEALLKTGQKNLQVDPLIAVVEKERDLNNKHVSKAIQVNGDVTGKIAILVDDIITSGGTILHAGAAVLKAGASSLVFACTHLDFIRAKEVNIAKKLQAGPAVAVFGTDTILLRPEDYFEKLKIVSVAPLISRNLAFKVK